MYSCAQSEEREQKAKVPKAEKSRDTRRMPRFPCAGWLHITASASSNTMQISVKHAVGHQPYLDIELPEEWKAYIREHGRTQTPGQARADVSGLGNDATYPFWQIWQHITRTEAAKRSVHTIKLLFRSKAVYYYWQIVTRDEWRLASTPLESARKFLEDKGEEYHIQSLDVEPEPGTEVLAFYITDFVEGWAEHTQELAMDSTCKPVIQMPDLGD